LLAAFALSSPPLSVLLNFTLVNLGRIFSDFLERKQPTGTGAQNIGELFKF
jgi:hypothetical protein